MLCGFSHSEETFTIYCCEQQETGLAKNQLQLLHSVIYVFSDLGRPSESPILTAHPQHPYVTGPRIGTTATKYVCEIQHECSSNKDTEHSVHHPDCILFKFSTI